MPIPTRRSIREAATDEPIRWARKWPEERAAEFAMRRLIADRLHFGTDRDVIARALCRRGLTVARHAAERHHADEAEARALVDLVAARLRTA